MIYKLTDKGRTAKPGGDHNIETWGRVMAFINAGGGSEITKGQFLHVAREHDHPDGSEGYLYHVVNRNEWLEES